MSRAFDFILGIVGLLVATGLVGAGFFMAIKRSYSPGRMLIKCLFTIPFVLGCLLSAIKMGPYGPFLIVFMAVVLSFLWTPHIAEIVCSPLTNLFDGGNVPPERKPHYSIATSKRKRGQYLEAMVAVREQLAAFPEDFEGIILLASIQAENLQDLPGAENTLNQFCARHKSSPSQVSAAWTTLADWYLKIGMDVDSARSSLQKIIERFPETELALRAEQRIAHLVETEKILMDQHDRPTIHLPEGVKDAGLLDSTEFLKPKEIDPGKLAAAHVKHLEAHPHDAEVREKLAVIYGKDFHRLDLATMELGHLINEPRYSPKQVASWLNLLANLQIEAGADVATVTATLQEIVDRFPDLSLAEVTRRRLVRINSELKGREARPEIKLGNYEQNIGLKYGAPGSKS
jgi:tetratricopeptide (TPR) repeat protein